MYIKLVRKYGFLTKLLGGGRRHVRAGFSKCGALPCLTQIWGLGTATYVICLSFSVV